MRFNILRRRARTADNRRVDKQKGNGSLPNQLPLGGRRRGGMKSSNGSHSTGSKTVRSSLGICTLSGAGVPSTSSLPSWTWEELEAELVQRVPGHTSPENLTRLRLSLAVDPGFEARQKKWLELLTKSINQARSKQEEMINEVEQVFHTISAEVEEGVEKELDAAVEEEADDGDDVKEKQSRQHNQECRPVSPSLIEENQVVPMGFSDISSFPSAHSDILSPVQDLVSYDDDLSATSFEVLMTYLGCYESFDESECELARPSKIVFKNNLRGGGSNLKDHRHRISAMYK